MSRRTVHPVSRPEAFRHHIHARCSVLTQRWAIVWFGIGAATGAAAALLFTSNAGENWRAGIATGAREAFERSRSASRGVAGNASDVVRERAEKLRDAWDAGTQAYREAQNL